jgi:hypothetical protein
LLLLLLLLLVVMILVLLLLFLLGFVLGQADVLLPGSLLQLQMLLATAQKGAAAAAVGPGDCGAVGVVAVGVWLPPAHHSDQEQGQSEGPAVATG